MVSTLLLVALPWPCFLPKADGAESSPVGEGAHSLPSKKWRVITLGRSYGWAMGEVELYKDPSCQQKLPIPTASSGKASSKPGDNAELTSEVIASGYSNTRPDRAFDGLTWTEWRAQCYICEPRDAWIGLQFSAPVSVLCMRLYQWGSRDYRTSEAVLERWDSLARQWKGVLHASELDGDDWDTVHFIRCAELSPPDHGRVVVTNGGYYPSSATYSCSGARVMGGSDKQECLESGEWDGGKPQCWPAIAPVILVVTILGIEVSACAVYYVMVVRKKPPPLEDSTFIPEDQMGKWLTHEIHGIKEPVEEEEEDPVNYLLHVTVCPCCRISETWYSAGQVPFFVGAWIPHLLCPFMPCIGAYFRWQMRSRLMIKGSHMRDCLLWLFCVPCVATQEAKQIDKMCDVAAEEAEVMRQAAMRKQEREDKLREAREEISGTRIGRSEGVMDKKGTAKAQDSKVAQAKPKVAPGTSVMDYLSQQ